MKTLPMIALLSSAAILPIPFQGIAFAQDSATVATGATAVADDANSGVGEIIVTAQRRSESSFRVPLSVSAFSDTDMTRLSINSVNSLQFATPGLTFPNDNAVTLPYIRGRGSNFSGPGLEGSVALYIDDVYQQSQYGTAELVDTSQIQVLKGPQGTLYGRNATGGAILVRTSDPTHEFGGHVQAGYGNMDAWEGEAVLNLPVSETLAVRFAAGAAHRDGPLKSVVDGGDRGGMERYQARMKVLWEPSDKFSALLKTEYQQREQQYQRKLIYDGAARPTTLGFYETLQSPITPRRLGGENRTKVYSGILRLNYQAGDWAFTNTLSYREMRTTTCSDNDFIYPVIQSFCVSVPKGEPRFPQGLHGAFDKTLINEFRVSSPDDRPLRVTAGAVYQNSDSAFPGILRGSAFGNFLPVFDGHIKLTSYAAYAEGYYDVTQNVKITVGGRYNKDTKKLNVTNSPDVAPAFGIPPGVVPAQFGDKRSFENFTPRFVVAYDKNDVNLYASYSKGFKSGGFNVPSFLPGPVLSPEKTAAVEIGGKFKFFDNRVRLDIAAFSMKSDNLQVVSIDRNIVIQQNAAAAKAKGVEANLQLVASDQLKLQFGGAYLHSRFTKFPSAAVFSLQNGLIAPDSENLAGAPTTNSPDVTLNGNATYSFELPRDWSGSVTLVGRYTSGYDFSAGASGPLRFDHQDGFSIVNLTGVINLPGDRLSVNWYVNNLFKTHYYDQIQTNSGNLGVYGVVGMPRTYGATVRYTF